ncbi:MAG: hypothetical protein M3N54_12270 [Acidobacteriota bacterium]|nr:hypothetical protein [Acidobacteriota bacterium]
MKRILIVFLMSGAVSLPAFAQREFLTNNEIDQIREAQEPNARLKIYLLFARQRLDQLQQQITKDKKGRSLVVRQLLEEYTQIIDAIDTVSDDALKRKVDIAEGAAAVAEAEAKFVTLLKKVEDSQPHDLDMYEVALKNAIENTGDSLETAKEDLGKRAQVVTAKADKEKKEIESLTGKDQLKQQKTEDAKADDGKPQRKPPTLYRPGEKPGDPIKDSVK